MMEASLRWIHLAQGGQSQYENEMGFEVTKNIKYAKQENATTQGGESRKSICRILGWRSYLQ